VIKKIAAVLLPVACVLTLGASLIAWFAVPSVHPAMESLQDYSFEAKPGATTTWTVTRRVGDEGSVASGTSGFDAVIKAQKDMAQRLNSRTTEMRTLHDAANSQLGSIQAQQQQDLEAVENRASDLTATIQQYEQQLLAQSAAFQDLSVQSRMIRDEVGLRREDVTRLRAELEELRTDLFRLTELQRVLTDRLLRIQIDNRSLLEREEQLNRQLAGT